jgi:hypothetical protein
MSPREAIANLANTPNRILENFFMKKTYNSFGRMVAIPPEYLATFRKEINRRNNDGFYKFINRGERRKMPFVRFS